MGDATRAAVARRSRFGHAGPPRTAPRDAPPWIGRAVRIFYVHPRRVGLRAQLCLRDPEGRELGWKDVASGRVMVRDESDRGTVVGAILEAAGPAQRPLPSDRLPGVALDLPAGTVLAQLRLRSAALLVGKESTDDGHHLLYATFARPGKPAITLGFVDLVSGARFPCPEDESGLDPETTAQLLDAVVACRPREHLP